MENTHKLPDHDRVEEQTPDSVCEHGTAMDVHCCNCHGGFLFDTSRCVCELSDPVIEAARRADWLQVVLNGGPPCFHLTGDGRFCLAAERWAGHGVDHPFHSLADLLASRDHPTPEEPI